MSAAIEIRRFDKPDQVLDMKAHATFEPGWVWDVDEPLLGNPPSCPMRHTGYCIAGRLVVRMVETNVKTNIGPGDFFEIHPVTMPMSREASASSWSWSRRPSTRAD